MRDLDRIELTFKRYVQQTAVSEELFLDLEASVVPEDLLFGQVMFQLRAKILTDDLPPEKITARQRVTYEVPASSWQMWKQRHGRRWYASWLVTRRPVRYEPDPDGRGTEVVCSFDLERFRTYPRARVQLPPDRFGPVVYSHTVRGPRWSTDNSVEEI